METAPDEVVLSHPIMSGVFLPISAELDRYRVAEANPEIPCRPPMQQLASACSHQQFQRLAAESLPKVAKYSSLVKNLP